MAAAGDAVLLVHIVSVVLMAAPYYNLVVVNARGKLGRAPILVDRYVETVVRGNAVRCFILQGTVLASGLGLLVVEDTLSALATNWALLAKTVLLALLVVSLMVVHFGIQPRIDGLVGSVTTDAIPPEIATQLGPLRLLRKRMAAGCLFVVLTIIIVALQIHQDWEPWLFAVTEVAAAGLALATYKRGAPWAWV